MLPDFQYVLAHPDILSELPAIRGLLRKRYPNLQNGLLMLKNCIFKKCVKNSFRCRFINFGFSAYDKTLHKRY